MNPSSKIITFCIQMYKLKNIDSHFKKFLIFNLYFYEKTFVSITLLNFLF